MKAVYTNPQKQASFERIVKLASELVDKNNAHGEALEVIAEFFELRKHKAKLECINKLHLLYGYLPSQLRELRDVIASDLIYDIEQKEGLNVAEILNEAL